jgi:hypothetical protein
MALGQGGAWSCGGTVPLSANFNANHNRFTNLGVNLTTGDALSQGQSHLNELAAATASYSMGGNKLQSLGTDGATGDALSRNQSTLNSLAGPTASVSMNSQKLTGLTAGSANGDSLSFGQSGFSLNGLALNGNPLTGLAAATALSQGLAYGQGGGQLARVQMPKVIGVATANGSATTLTINVPAGSVNGTDALFAVISVQGGGSITPPAGWTQIGTYSCAGGGINCQGIFDHIITNSEPANYTWTDSATTNQFDGGIALVRNVNQTTPVDTSSTAGTGGSTLSIPALAPTTQGELALFGATTGGAEVLIGSTPAGAHNLWFQPNIGWGANVYSFPLFNTTGYAISVGETNTANNTFTTNEVLIRGLAGAPTTIPTLGSDSGLATNYGSNNNGSNIIQGYNVDNEFNVMAYGAINDASGDSSGAFQAAVNAACAAQQFPSGAVYQTPGVWVPAGEYLLLKPIIVQCPNGAIHFRGAGMGATSFVQKTNAIGQSHGPIIIDTVNALVSSIAPTTATALATGAGAALNFAGAYWMLDLSDTLRDFGGTPFNGKPQFDMRAFAKLSSTQANGATIICSNGSADNQNGNSLRFPNLGATAAQGGAACLYVDGNLALRCSMNIGGTLKSAASANGNFTTATTHEAECSYDGSSLRLFLDGSLLQTVAASGNISQRVDEDMTVGGFYGTFPIANPQSLWVGQLDSIEVSGTARHTAAYTMDTAKFSGDGNSILLLNGDNTINFPGQSTPAVFGLDRWNGQDLSGFGSNTQLGAWMLVRNTAFAAGAGNQLSDFSATGSVGLLAYLATNGRYTNLQLSGSYAGFLLTHSAFNTRQTNLRLSSSTFAAYMDTDASGVTHAKDLQLDSCGAMCMAISVGGGSWQGTYMAPQSNTKWAVLINNLSNSFTNYTFDDISEDDENGGNSTGVLIDSLGSYTFRGGGITSIGSGAPLTISSVTSFDNIAVHVQDMPVNFTYPSGPTTIFNFEGAYPVNGSASAEMQNVMYSNGASSNAPGLPSGVSFSNNASFAVDVLGNGGWTVNSNLALATVPTLSAGLNHLAVNSISDPAAATISVVGTTGGSAYGPYYVVCHDYNGGVTNPSAASNTIANGPASLTTGGYIHITWAGNTACKSWDVLKGNLTTALYGALPAGTTAVNDQGGATSTYSPPARNTTGDSIVGGMQISSGISWPLPASVVNGASFYCPNCDPPANPPVTCSSSGARTGSWVHGLNNQWLCTP